MKILPDRTLLFVSVQISSKVVFVLYRVDRLLDVDEGSTGKLIKNNTVYIAYLPHITHKSVVRDLKTLR